MSKYVSHAFKGSTLGGSVNIMCITITIAQSSFSSLGCATPALDIKNRNAFTQLKVGKITSFYGNRDFSGEN